MEGTQSIAVFSVCVLSCAKYYIYCDFDGSQDQGQSQEYCLRVRFPMCFLLNSQSIVSHTLRWSLARSSWRTIRFALRVNMMPWTAYITRTMHLGLFIRVIVANTPGTYPVETPQSSQGHSVVHGGMGLSLGGMEIKTWWHMQTARCSKQAGRRSSTPFNRNAKCFQKMVHKFAITSRL